MRYVVLSWALLCAASANAVEPPLPVVATFSILADMASEVGGDAVAVTSLVAAGSDVHVFQPGPSDARQLAQAGLVVANGLGFEGWIDRLVRASGYRGTVVVASAGIEPLHGDASHASSANLSSHANLADQGTAAAPHGADPHAWQSVPNAKRYVANLTNALCAAATASCPVFRDNAARYQTKLDTLDRDIRDMLSAIPPERRTVITSHDAFAYYAREYGVRFLAPLGISTESEPSAAAVGRLIRQIRKERVNAFFVEGISDPRLIERIRDETGGARAGRLYSDALSAPDGPAPNYPAMMRYNTEAITAALSAPPAMPAARR